MTPASEPDPRPAPELAQASPVAANGASAVELLIQHMASPGPWPALIRIAGYRNGRTDVITDGIGRGRTGGGLS